ncbi:hypothetical protein JW979_10165 [bacterium]|nr:hypothetical protein [candidate division CSSED10-310 bacterium]
MDDMQNISTETAFEAFLDKLDDTLKTIGYRRGIASFNRLIGEPHENLEKINEDSMKVFLNDRHMDVIRHWKDKVTDPRTHRRTQIFYRDFLAAKVENNPELFKKANDLESVIVAFQPEIAAKSYSRSELGQILESSPNRDLRKKAYWAGKKLDDDIEEGVKDLIQTRNSLAKKLGYKDYIEMGFFFQDLDEQELRGLFDTVKKSTDLLWNETLENARIKLGVEKLETWDLGYYFHRLMPAPEPERFPKAQIIPIFNKALTSAGGNLEKLPIQVIVKDIPYGGLCMGIEYGKDIRILANPRDGLQWYDALFHEFGHGIHGSLLDTSSYLVASGDPAFFWEGVAGIFERFVHQPAFLQEHFALTPEETEQMLFLNKISRIAWFRRIACTCLLEWSAYRNEKNLREKHADLLEEYTGIRPPENSGWAGNTLFTTHPLYTQNYLLMDVMALHTIKAFENKFGRYPGPELFNFVVSYYIRPAGWIPWREKIQNATGSLLSADALVDYLLS